MLGCFLNNILSLTSERFKVTKNRMTKTISVAEKMLWSWETTHFSCFCSPLYSCVLLYILAWNSYFLHSPNVLKCTLCFIHSLSLFICWRKLCFYVSNVPDIYNTCNNCITYNFYTTSGIHEATGYNHITQCLFTKPTCQPKLFSKFTKLMNADN